MLPTDIFPGYELLANGATTTAQGIFIPLSDFAGLTAGEANATTGDGRKVCFEIAKKTHASFAGLSTEDKPTKMTTSVGTPTGINATTVRRAYTFTFDLDVADVDMAAE